MKNIKPFGPSIAKVTIPKNIVDQLNEHTEQIIKDILIYFKNITSIDLLNNYDVSNINDINKNVLITEIKKQLFG